MLKSSRMSVGGGDIFDPTMRDVIGTTQDQSSSQFYFQQRRGRLDIRSVAQIDVDRIVRDVDIDLLQIHLENLTFSELKESDLRYLTDPQIIKLFRTSQLMIEYLLFVQDHLSTNLQQLANKYIVKKRSLAKKRIELVSLQESTKHLREEVRFKKNSVVALEELLKTAHQSSEQRRRKQSTGTSAKDDSTAEQSAGTEMGEGRGIRQPVVRFFVTAPDGLCVEFNEKRTSSILHLVREVRKAFVPRNEILRYRRINNDVEGPTVRLVYQGRIMTEDGTVESNELRDGDTIVAIIDRDDDDDMAGTSDREGDSESKRSDMARLLFQQQETMQQVAHEMKRGLDMAMSSMRSNSNRNANGTRDFATDGTQPPDADLVDKWNQFERTMWNQLDSKMEQYKEQIAVDVGRGLHPDRLGGSRALEFGDLESDGEEPRTRAPRVRSTEATAAALDARTVETIDKLCDSVEELTDVIRSTSHTQASLAQSTAAPQAAHLPARVAVQSAPVASSASTATVPSAEASPRVAVAGTPSTSVVVSRKPPSTVKWSEDQTRPTADRDHAPPSSHLQPQQGTGAANAILTAAKPADNKRGATPMGVPTPIPMTLDSPADQSGFQDDIEEIFMEQSPPKPAAATPQSRLVESAVDGQRLADAGASAPPTDVAVLFPYIHMDATVASIAASSGERDWSFSVKTDLPVDDLVFELRRGVSDKADVPLKRVALVLRDKTFTIAIDMPALEGGELTAVRAAKLAADGALTIKISQLESSAAASKKAGSVGVSDGAGGVGGAAGRVSLIGAPRSQPPLPQHRSTGSRDSQDVDWGGKGETQLRKSLEATLQELSDKEGLSDVELADKMRALRRSTSASPELFQHISEFRVSVSSALDAATVESPRPDDPPVSLQLSAEEKVKLREQLRDGSRGLRESRDSTVESGGSGGVVRLSLPNTNRSRRTAESIENDEEFKMFGSSAMNQSAISIRGYDEDSVPMMQSLSSFPTPLARAQPGEDDLDEDEGEDSRVEASNLDERGGMGAMRESAESMGGRIPAKRISFDDDRESKDNSESFLAGAKGASGMQAARGGGGLDRKSVERSSLYDSQSLADVDEDSLGGVTATADGTGTGTLSFAISEPDHRTSTESTAAAPELGGTGRTVSTLGASISSGSIPTAPPKDGRSGAVEGVALAVASKDDMGDRKGQGAGVGDTGDLSRFDLERTIDSEGEMLRGGGAVNPAQVKSAADAYERGGRGPDATDKPDTTDKADKTDKTGSAGRQDAKGEAETGARGGARQADAIKSPPPQARPTGLGLVGPYHPAITASPASKGSSFTNSGLFDNLTDNDIDADRTRDAGRGLDASNSLALSDSAGMFDDNDTKM